MRKVILFLIFIFLFSSSIFATTYYIKTTGNDGNTGLGTADGEAWLTMSKANTTLTAGDTVEILAGTYTGASNRINPDNSGSDGSPITYTNYNDDTVTLQGTGGDAITLTSNSYITIDGINVDGENPYPSATINSWIAMEDSDAHHNIVQNGIMEYCNSWQGVIISLGAHHNKVLNNTLRYCGLSEPPATGGADAGDLLQLTKDAHHNLIEGNDITGSGHNLIALTPNGGIYTCSYNIIRNNILHNEYINADNYRGGRNISVAPEGGECKYNLIENNIIRDSDQHQNNDPNHPNLGMKSVGSNNIVRRNRIYNNIGQGIRQASLTGQTPEDNRVYHNSIYHNGHGGGTAKTGMAWHKWDGAYGGDVYKNNILYDNNAGNYFFGAGVNEGWFTFVNNHEAGDPRFVNPGAGDFHLRSDSPCRNAGAWLTTITSVTGSGTSFIVDDAGYFCDGLEMITGDEIQLEGKPTSVTITAVNYGTDTITVDESVSWTQGDGVALAYDGAAPDQGAYEYEEDEEPTRAVLRIREVLRIRNKVTIK